MVALHPQHFHPLLLSQHHQSRLQALDVVLDLFEEILGLVQDFVGARFDVIKPIALLGVVASSSICWSVIA